MVKYPIETIPSQREQPLNEVVAKIESGEIPWTEVTIFYNKHEVSPETFLDYLGKEVIASKSQKFDVPHKIFIPVGKLSIENRSAYKCFVESIPEKERIAEAMIYARDVEVILQNLKTDPEQILYKIEGIHGENIVELVKKQLAEAKGKVLLTKEIAEKLPDIAYLDLNTYVLLRYERQKEKIAALIRDNLKAFNTLESKL